MSAANGDRVRVLVVDDEPAIRRYLRVSLPGQGYTVLEADSGQAAIAAVTVHRPDLVILDLGLPDMDGVEVTQLVREWAAIPIIILSVSEREEDKIAALDAGADDYVTKPFRLGELLARMRTAIRHAGPAKPDPVYQVGDLVVDLSRRMVKAAGNEVQLTPTEYDLLRTMVKHAGQVLTHRHLLREIWGTERDANLHLLRVNVSNLRHKIESDPLRPRYVLTEPGVGYRFKADD